MEKRYPRPVRVGLVGKGLGASARIALSICSGILLLGQASCTFNSGSGRYRDAEFPNGRVDAGTRKDDRKNDQGKDAGQIGSGVLDACIDYYPAYVEPPANVRVTFRVVGCDGNPVGRLNQVVIIDDEKGEPFGSRNEGDGIAVQAPPSELRLVVTLALDFSDSIVLNPYCMTSFDAARCPLTAMIAAARELIHALLADDAATAGRTYIQLIAFGRFEAITQEVPFTRNLDLLDYTLAALEDSGGRGTTALYDAYVRAIETTAAQYPHEPRSFSKPDEIAEKIVVIFTDGTDQAGNQREREQAALGARRRYPDIHIYSIGLEAGPSFDVEKLIQLASLRENYIPAEEVDNVQDAFQEVATRISELANSNYAVGVCTPVEFGPTSLTIRVESVRGYAGEITVPYNADDPLADLNGYLAGCDPAEIVQDLPTYGDVDGGVRAGTCRDHNDCAPSEFCNAPSCDPGSGTCVARPFGTCSKLAAAVCDCDGVAHANPCEAAFGDAGRIARTGNICAQ